MRKFFTVHHVHHFPEIRELLEKILPPLATKEDLDMISAEIQTVLDQAKANASLVQSVHLGMQALTTLVANLNTQIAAIPVAPAPGLSDEDKAALVEAGKDLSDAATTLQSDIPANTAATT